MSKKMMVAFPLTVPDGAGVQDVQKFVQEALMRMHRDLERTITNAAEQEVWDQFRIPMQAQIQVAKRS